MKEQIVPAQTDKFFMKEQIVPAQNFLKIENYFERRCARGKSNSFDAKKAFGSPGILSFLNIITALRSRHPSPLKDSWNAPQTPLFEIAMEAWVDTSNARLPLFFYLGANRAPIGIEASFFLRAWRCNFFRTIASSLKLWGLLLLKPLKNPLDPFLIQEGRSVAGRSDALFNRLCIRLISVRLFECHPLCSSLSLKKLSSAEHSPML